MTHHRAWLLAPALLAACVEPIDDPLAEDGTTPAAAFATEDDSSPAADSTVKLPGCTGTLVSPRHVLTAASCVVDPPTPPTASNIAGDVFLMARDGYLYEMDIGGETPFDLPWRAGARPAPGVNLRAAVDDGPYNMRYFVTAEDRLLGQSWDGAVVDMGSGGGVVALARRGPALELLGVTAAGAFVVNPVGGSWTAAPGFPALPQTIALATGGYPAGDEAYYAATADGRIHHLATGGWRVIDQVPGLESLTSGGSYLYARVGGQVLMRRAVPWRETWAIVGDATPGALLLAAVGPHQLSEVTATVSRERLAFRHWVRGVRLPCPAAGVTRVGARTYTHCADRNELFGWLDGGAPRSYGAQPLGAVRGLGDDGAALVAGSATGVWRATLDAAGQPTWSRIVGIPAPPAGTLSLDAIGDAYYAHAADTGWWVAPGAAAWSAFAEPWAQSVAGGFAPIDPDLTDPDFVVRRTISPALMTRWSAFASDRHLASQPPARELTVQLGRDVALHQPCATSNPRCRRVTGIRVAPRRNLALLELDAAVPSSVATPAPTSATVTPELVATAPLVAKGFGALREGESASHLLGLDADAAASTPADDLGQLAPLRSPVDLALDRDLGFAIDFDGTVWRRSSTRAFDLPVQVPRDAYLGVAIDPTAAPGAQVVLATATRVARHATATGAIVAYNTPPIQAWAGERITGVAQHAGMLWVTTSWRKVWRQSLLGGAAVDMGTSPIAVRSLAIDGYGRLFGLGPDGIYQREGTTSWRRIRATASTAAGAYAALGAHERLYMVTPGESRYRRRSSFSGVTVADAVVSVGDFLARPVGTRGDVGGPLFATGTSTFLVGVLQPASLDPTARPRDTWHLLLPSTSWAAENTLGWLHYLLGR